MALNVAKEVAAMREMTVPDLRRKYAEVFGEECRSRQKSRTCWTQRDALGRGYTRPRRRSRPSRIVRG